MKFYVTGLYHTEEFNDRTLPPIEVEASNRVDALMKIGMTIWTEDEWKAAEPHMYGVSDEEMSVVHGFTGTGMDWGESFCGETAWSGTSIKSGITCPECITLVAAKAYHLSGERNDERL